MACLACGTELAYGGRYQVDDNENKLILAYDKIQELSDQLKRDPKVGGPDESSCAVLMYSERCAFVNSRDVSDVGGRGGCDGDGGAAEEGGVRGEREVCQDRLGTDSHPSNLLLCDGVGLEREWRRDSRVWSAAWIASLDESMSIECVDAVSGDGHQFWPAMPLESVWRSFERAVRCRKQHGGAQIERVCRCLLKPDRT
eukprot:3862208-Rhodomonas_salina.1